jgi:hypothetical protein
VKTDGAKPELSCALKLPGNPKYFFYHGKELVLLVNGMSSGTSANEAALLRFGISATGFDFLDAVMLDNQQIQDARLFDSTLVIYANLFSPPPPRPPPWTLAQGARRPRYLSTQRPRRALSA